MENGNEKVPSLIPALMVEDVKEAIAFYKHLGFSEGFSIPDQTGEVLHAHLHKADNMLFLGRLGISHYEGHERAMRIKTSQPSERGLGVTLILQVDDLVEIYDFVRDRELEILTEPADEYYGDRVFFFIDPFGYEWKISQPIESVN